MHFIMSPAPYRFVMSSVWLNIFKKCPLYIVSTCSPTICFIVAPALVRLTCTLQDLMKSLLLAQLSLFVQVKMIKVQLKKQDDWSERSVCHNKPFL